MLVQGRSDVFQRIIIFNTLLTHPFATSINSTRFFAVALTVIVHFLFLWHVKNSTTRFSKVDIGRGDKFIRATYKSTWEVGFFSFKYFSYIYFFLMISQRQQLVKYLNYIVYSFLISTVCTNIRIRIPAHGSMVFPGFINLWRSTKLLTQWH